MKKRVLVLFLTFMSLLSLSACKNENKVLELSKKNLNLEVDYNQIIEVVNLEEVNVYLLHKKHDEKGGFITVEKYDYAGDYRIIKKCPLMCFVVYSKKTNDVLFLDGAYNEGWIKQEDLESIAEGYNNALKKTVNHGNDTYDYCFKLKVNS